MGITEHTALPRHNSLHRFNGSGKVAVITVQSCQRKQRAGNDFVAGLQDHLPVGHCALVRSNCVIIAAQ